MIWLGRCAMRAFCISKHKLIKSSTFCVQKCIFGGELKKNILKNFEIKIKFFNFVCPRTDNGGRGPCSAFGKCFLLSHSGVTDQEHTIKHAVEKDYSCITSYQVRCKVTNIKMMKIQLYTYLCLSFEFDGQTDGRTNGWTDEQTDGRNNTSICPSIRLSVSPSALQHHLLSK